MDSRAVSTPLIDDLGVSAMVVRAFLDAGRRLGVDDDALLRDFELPRELVDDAGHWFPIEVALGLLNETAARSRDPDFGLHLGAQTAFGGFGLFEYLPATAATIGEALEKAVTLSRLLTSRAWLALSVKGDVARFGRHDNRTGWEPTRHAAELFMAGLVVRIRNLTRADWSPIEVRFQHPPPRCTDEHARIFGTVVRFDAPLDEILVSRDLLAEPLVTADPNLAALLDRCAREMIPSGRERAGLIAHVRDAIIRQLHAQRPGLDALARTLGVSSRTLQRRLRDAGTSHQQLLDTTRKDVAKRALADPTLSITEAALASGFTGLSGFYIAFRRWTGVTPGRFRRTWAPWGRRRGQY